jgi:putative transposase
MSGQRLTRGMKILWNGSEFVIEERLSDGRLRLLNKLNDERRLVEKMELIEAASNGNLKILGSNNETRNLEEKMQRNRIYDFTALDDDDPRKIEAIKKYEYIRNLTAEKKAGFTEQEIIASIEMTAARIDDSTPPSVRNVRRWISQHVTSGEDIRALVDEEKSKGNRLRKFCRDSARNQEILKIINDAIDEDYLTTQQNTKRHTCDLIEYRIYKINEHRSENNQLPLPSYKSVCRIINQLDEYEVDKARKGARFANEKHKTLQKGPEPTRPLERVECDDTKTDLLVIDPATSLALGRPWLMILICVFTRMILGYHLSFYPPSHVTVMMAMKHAIRPKLYVKEKYPDIIYSWDTYGLIEVLVIDNAKHWYGKGIEDACYQLGTDMQFAPVRVPWYKGAVERLLQTIHSGLIHQQPGTTFSNIFDKGDYDPAKHAVIWLDLLDELLHKWIIDVYSQEIHTGMNDILARRWENSIVEYPPALPPAHTDLDIILGKIAYRKISGTAIHFQNLEYSDSILATIRTNQDKEGRVKIKYDPTDLGMIYVYDAFWCRFVPVPAVDQDYAKGLTEFQHEVVCKFIRRKNQARINRKELAEAKEYIRRKIAEAFGRAPRSLKSAGKIARWMAFEDPAEARIIYHSKNDMNPAVDGKDDANSPDPDAKLLKGKVKFVLPTEQTDKTLEWNDDETWGAIYSDFNQEEL